MSLARRSRYLLPALLALGPAWAAVPTPTTLPPVVAEAHRVMRLDTQRSQIGFEVRTGEIVAEGSGPDLAGRFPPLDLPGLSGQQAFPAGGREKRQHLLAQIGATA